MTFAQPFWLLTLLPLVPLLVLLHLRRKRQQTVSSLVVWRRVRTTSSTARWRKALPVSTMSLILQLLVAVGLALALARPSSFGTSGIDNTVILIDASTTMRAVDAEPDRFALAVDHARNFATRADRGRLLTIVAVGPQPTVVAARLTTVSDIAQRFAGVRTTDAVADWTAALDRVGQLVAPDETAEVIVIGDTYSLANAAAAIAQHRDEAWSLDSVELISIAGHFRGLGLADVQVERQAGDWTWRIDGRVTVYGDSPPTAATVHAAFEATSRPGALPWESVEVGFEGRDAGKFTFELTLPGPGILEIRLAPGGPLGAHDRVAFLLDAEPHIRVLRVGPDNPPLDRALRAAPNVDLFRAAELPEYAGDFDLVVVDRVEVDAVPATSTAWIGTVPPGLRTRDVMSTPLSMPQATRWRAGHPLSIDADWPALQAGSAAALPVLAGGISLVEAASSPLIQARTTDLGRQVVIAFDVLDTTWPAQVSFPAFVAALVEWSTPAWHRHEVACHVGSPCTLPRQAFALDWQLVDPDGIVVLEPWNAVATVGDPMAAAVWPEGVFDSQFVPDRTGVYHLLVGDDRIGIPVNTATFEPIGAEVVGDDLDPRSAIPSPGTEWWQWIALAAGGILVAEAVHAGLGRERFLRRSATVPAASRRGHRIVVALGTTVATIVAAVAGLAMPSLQQRPVGALIFDAHEGWEQVDSDLLATLAALGDAGVPVVTIGERDANTTAGEGQPGSMTARTIFEAIDASIGALPPRADGGFIRVHGAGGATMTAADFAQASASLLRHGLELHVDPPLRMTEPATAIDDIGTPHVVRAGDTVDVSVLVESNANRQVEALLELAGVQISATTLNLQQGESRHAIETVIPDTPAVDVLRVALVGTDGEVLAEAFRALSVDDAVHVLLLSTHEAAAGALAERLRVQGLSVHVDLPRRFPPLVERLEPYDVLVLLDVPAVAISTAHQELLRSWVRDHGGGLVIFGGESSFGPGGYFQTPLEDLSPLSARFTDESPEVTLVFVLDRSGSMQARVGPVTRLDIAKEATIGALDLLDEQSLVGFVAFDAEAEVLADLQPLTQRDALLGAVQRLRAGGGTAIYPGLVEAYELLRDSDSASKHVIVMTDGLSQPDDFETILAALRGVNATTSFVGIGDGADRSQLQRLAELGGGSFHMTTDFRALPSIMAQEAMLYAADPIERTTVAAEWRGTRPPFVRGIDVTPPPLHGLVRTSTKAEASLHLVGGDDNPLLATWRYGLGRVAAFASQAIGPWAEAWATVPEMQALWPQLIRWVTTDSRGEPSELRVHSDGRAITIALDAYTDSGTPRRNLVLYASVSTETSATGADDGRRMTEVRPGRYEVDIPVRPPPESFTVTIRDSTPDGPGGPATVGTQRVVAPAAWVPGGLPPARPLVGELMRVAGGGDPETAAITLDFARSAVSRRLAWQPMAQAWLLIAVASFAFTVLLRYRR